MSDFVVRISMHSYTTPYRMTHLWERLSLARWECYLAKPITQKVGIINTVVWSECALFRARKHPVLTCAKDGGEGFPATTCADSLSLAHTEWLLAWGGSDSSRDGEEASDKKSWNFSGVSSRAEGTRKVGSDVWKNKLKDHIETSVHTELQNLLTIKQILCLSSLFTPALIFLFLDSL